MKTNHLTALIAIGSLLPLTTWGADDTAGKYSIQREAYDPRPSETRSGPPTSRLEETRDRQTSTRSRTDLDADAAGATSSHGSSAGIERIDSNELEQRTTASDLIGSKVVDREGQELGKVKDIGLTAVTPQLSAPPAGASFSRDRDARQSRASSVSATDTSGVSHPGSESPGLRSATGNPATHTSNEDPYLAEQRLRRDVERAGTAGSRSDAASTSLGAATGDRGGNRDLLPAGDPAETQPRIFVQPDRSLGLKGDLVAIPADRIHREGDTLRVDMSREELRAIVARQDASRVSMNR